MRPRRDPVHPHPPRPLPGGRAARGATGAPVIGCAPLTLEDDGPRADAAFDPDYRPTACWRTARRLGPGWTLAAVATPGHTSNHLCFALETGALFTGDHVMGWSTSVVSPPDGDMTAYMASLAKLYGASRTRSISPPMARRWTSPGSSCAG
jgi:glyoxylase-like metal-dependent hydrolase (beta-lactamase superfamily II)